MILNKINLSTLNTYITEYDLFICSSSFEDRCLSIPTNIDISKIKATAIVYNKNYYEQIKLNHKKLISSLGQTVTTIEISTDNPLLTADNLSKYILELNTDIRKILVDLTTFTHESLLILLKIMQMYLAHVEINCVYASANDYGVDSDIEEKWLSVGLKEIRSVLGYPGMILPSKKTHLVIVVGYEYDRALRVIEEIEPTSISLVYGMSGSGLLEDKGKDANKYFMDLVKAAATSYLNIEQKEIKCNDLDEAVLELERIVDTHNDMNIIIAPMNNKITTLATAIVAMKNNDVQLCYSSVLAYNYDKYSIPGEKCYLFTLTLPKITNSISV